jgi:hypothetical protein
MRWVGGVGVLMLLGCGRENASFGDELDNPEPTRAAPQPEIAFDAGILALTPPVTRPPPPNPTVTVPIVCGPQLACPAGNYCDYPVAARCGDGNATGECKAPATGCTMQSAPVCGCDGVTYLNDCQASAASMPLRSAADGCEADAGVK